MGKREFKAKGSEMKYLFVDEATVLLGFVR
jgi:hypothetical protein